MILKKLSGPGPSLTVSLVQDVLTIGRAPGNGAVLADPAVSSRHASLVYANGEVSLYDLNSTNGIKVNGIKGAAFRLVPGDVIALGGTELTLAAEGPDRPSVPAVRATRELTEPDFQETMAEDFLGQSPPQREVAKKIRQVAPLDIPVLLSGETGTGKTAVAQLIHRGSGRSPSPFVTLDCTTLPLELAESELFGHCRGSFTGAAGDKIGKVEAAQGGTLFLDEIGELPLALQPKLLRFIQDRKFERIGETKSRDANVRLVVATNRDLGREVSQGRFRQDLYYRVNVFEIWMPPLRERGEDIVLLAGHFLRHYSHQLGRKNRPLSAAAQQKLRGHAWPGNVRELQNVLMRSLVTMEPDQPELDLELSVAPAPSGLNLRKLKDSVEADAITRALEKHGDNRSRAAGELGIDRHTLKSMMEKYGL
jgi:transcriptional regulator with GAF, ATPase, and Fis domain